MSRSRSSEWEVEWELSACLWGRSKKILQKSCIEIQEKLKIFQPPPRVVSPEFVQDFDAGFF